MKNFINRALVAKKHLKLFFALFAMLALGVGNAWGAEVTVTKTTNTLVSELNWSVSSGNTCAGCYTEFQLDEAITISTTGNPNCGSIWGTSTYDWRLYQNQSGNVIVSAKEGYELVSIKFTYTINNSGTLKDGSTTISSNAVVSCSGLKTKTLTVGNTSTKTNGQVRITTFSVTYVQTAGSGSSPVTPAKLPAPANLKEASITETSATLSWDAVANASNYSVTINGNTETVTINSYSATGLTAGTEYTWSVVANGDGTNYTDSDAAQHTFTTASPTPAPEPDPTPDPGNGGEALSFTWDLSTKTYTTGTNKVTWTTDGLATMHNSGTNATNYLGGDANNRSSSRFYTGNTLSITPAANVTITSVEFTATSSNYATTLKNSTWNNATASVSGSVVTVTPTNGASAISATISGTCGFTGVTVNYTKTGTGSGEPVVKTLDSIAVTGMKQEFVEGDEFTFGGTCTATYNDGTTIDVTKDATFTGYDMNQIGEQTIYVSYKEGDVTANTSYKINISEKTKYTITWNNAGTTNTTKVVQDKALGTLPKPKDDCPSGKKFMGWTAATEVNNDGSGIVYVTETDIPTSDTTYNAVFAVVTSTGEPVTSYKKVTTTSDGTYLIAATNGSSSYAYTGQVEGKKFGGYIGVTIENDEITAKPAEAAEITVKVTDGKFSMHDGSKYLYLSSSDNELHYNDTEQIVWALDADGKIDITTHNSRYLKFNANSGQERFACYSSAQKDAFLYKKVTTTPETKSDFSLDCSITVEPTWTISKDAIDFADKYVGVSYTETFTINASNLAEDIALAIEGSYFTVSPTSIAADATFPRTVTVTYAPTAADSHNATLNITSGSTLSKEIALTGSATEATIYTLTALADINPKDKVIIVGTSGGNTYAMSNDKGASDAPDAVAVTVTDNKIATDNTNILWNIAKNGDNLTIYPADQNAKWLYCLPDENDGVRVGTGNAKEFTIDKGYLYATKTTSARHIGIYNNKDWRCYKPNGDAIANNIKDQSFAFYVLPNTDPSISVTPSSKDFGVLTVSEEATQEFEITALNININEALTAELTGEGFKKSDIVDNKITITFAPTEVKEYSAILTIRAGTEASASVTLKGEGVAATYSVTYDKNSAEGDAPTDETKYVAGSKVTVADQGKMTKAGYRFAGWKYGEDTYKAGATFRMPAKDVTFVAQWVEKEDFSTDYWVLVTDASELNADDYVVIAAAEEDYAMKSYESGKNNCGQIGVKKANNLLIWNENVGVFQLAKSGENYTFQDVNTEQYLYAAGTGDNNYLKAADKIPAEAETAKPYIWTITIEDGVTTVKATSENRNTLRYNTGSDIFSCYASGQKDIALYKYVRVPVVELHSGDNSALINFVAGKTVNVQVNRTFTATDGYYTICLPFDIAASEIGKAYQVTSISDAGAEGFYMVFNEVTELVAGQPYLIEPKDLTNPIFEDVTIVNTTGETVTATGAGINFEMVGVINGGGQTEPGQYWVGEKGYFYNGDGRQTTAKLGLRVLFNITNTEGQRVNVRARVVLGENAATGLNNITNGENTTIKVIENGQLVIIRNGEKYNAQGIKF